MCNKCPVGLLANGPDHITNLVSMSIFGKSFKIFFSRIKLPPALKLSIQHFVLGRHHFCANGDPAAESCWFFQCLYMRNATIFSHASGNFLLAQNVEADCLSSGPMSSVYFGIKLVYTPKV